MTIPTLARSYEPEAHSTFKQFVAEELVSKLWQGVVVVMDNLPAHKVTGIQELIESVGARVVYSAPYSPDLNPIEHLWWGLKAFMRQFAPKQKATVKQLLELGCSLCFSVELKNYFTHCGYCATQLRKVRTIEKT